MLGIPHRVLYRSRLWWHKPDEFHPERWLPDEQRPKEFDNDRRDGFHPFSYGPRQCIAVKYESPHAPCFETISTLTKCNSLAYAEMRYILARLLWNFDFTITNESRTWIDDQKAYLVWDKPGLWLKVWECK